MYKINILGIIRDHVSTLKVSGAAGLSVTDLIVFFGIPAVASVWISQQGYLPDADFINQLLAACAIIFGFLLNMQALALGLQSRDTVLEKRLLAEISSNIAFCVLVSFFSVLILVVLIVLEKGLIYEYTFYFLIFLLLVLALTIIMVFKRMHSAIRNELA